MYDMYKDRANARRDLRPGMNIKGGSAEVARQREVCEIGQVGMPSLAMVYTPIQSFCSLYTNERGLRAGTIFAQLDKPFTVTRCGTCRGGGSNGCKI